VDLPPGCEITQIPATLLALQRITVSLDASPIEQMLDTTVSGDRRELGPVDQTPVDRPVYTQDEERAIVERLRDLGYE
jgi:hypothetical protein